MCAQLDAAYFSHDIRQQTTPTSPTTLLVPLGKAPFPLVIVKEWVRVDPWLPSLEDGQGNVNKDLPLFLSFPSILYLMISVFSSIALI